MQIVTYYYTTLLLILLLFLNIRWFPMYIQDFTLLAMYGIWDEHGLQATDLYLCFDTRGLSLGKCTLM